jgi:hypothetical protein
VEVEVTKVEVVKAEKRIPEVARRVETAAENTTQVK